MLGEGGIAEDDSGDVGGNEDAETAVGDYGWVWCFARCQVGDGNGEVDGDVADGWENGEL